MGVNSKLTKPLGIHQYLSFSVLHSIPCNGYKHILCRRKIRTPLTPLTIAGPTLRTRSRRYSPEAGMIRSIVVRMADGQTDRATDGRAIAGWRVLLLQWQPSSQLEWLLWQWRRRHNRRIVCGQIPRPLALVWHGGDGMEQQGRKEERKVGWLTFAPETDFSPRQPKNERKRRGNPSKRVAAFLVAPSPPLPPSPPPPSHAPARAASTRQEGLEAGLVIVRVLVGSNHPKWYTEICIHEHDHPNLYVTPSFFPLPLSLC